MQKTIIGAVLAFAFMSGAASAANIVETAKGAGTFRI